MNTAIKYKAVIFDAGDTLVEYSPNWARVFSDKIRSLGIDVSDDMSWEISKAVYWANGDQDRREENGSSKATKADRMKMYNEAALSCFKYSAGMKEKYLQMMERVPEPNQKLSVIPGVFDILNILREKYRLAIVSNWSVWLTDYLKECGLYDYFESIIVSAAVGVKKPNVRIMELAFKELDLSPEACLYVGDQPMDVLCAKQAGMDCAWITRVGIEMPGTIPFNADYRISNVTELLSIL